MNLNHLLFVIFLNNSSLFPCILDNFSNHLRFQCIQNIIHILLLRVLIFIVIWKIYANFRNFFCIVSNFFDCKLWVLENINVVYLMLSKSLKKIKNITTSTQFTYFIFYQLKHLFRSSTLFLKMKEGITALNKFYENLMSYFMIL